MKDRELQKQFEGICNKRLKVCLERLRRRFRPYKKRPFLDRPIELYFEYEEGKDYGGYYRNTYEKTTGFNRKWHHEITIGWNVFNRFKKYTEWYGKYRGEKWIYWNVDEVLMHELIHGFVFEEFDWWEFEGISKINADYSPIFLSCLAFNNQYGNPYSKEFYKSELFEKVKNIKKYDTLFTILVHMLHEIEKELRDINTNKTGDHVSLIFSSSHNTIRLEDKINFIIKCVTTEKKMSFINSNYIFSCGFMYDLSKLKDEYKTRKAVKEEINSLYITDSHIYMNGTVTDIKK